MSGRLEKWGDLPMARREAEVRALLKQGHSAGRIAARLSMRHGVKVSRNAVIGFCARRGLALAHRAVGGRAPADGIGTRWRDLHKDVRLKLVRELADAGMTSTAIAAEATRRLGVPVTGDAVKKFRQYHGLGEGVTGRPKAEARPKPVRAKVMRCGLPAAPDVMTPGAPLPRGIVVVRGPRHAADTVAAVMEAGPGTCRAPHGEPGEAGFRFCGATVTGKGAWCADHRARYFTRGISPDAD